MTDTPPLFDAAPLLPLPQPARAVVDVVPLLPIVPFVEPPPVVIVCFFEILGGDVGLRQFAARLKSMPHCLDFRKATDAEIEELFRYRRKPR